MVCLFKFYGVVRVCIVVSFYLYEEVGDIVLEGYGSGRFMKSFILVLECLVGVMSFDSLGEIGICIMFVCCRLFYLICYICYLIELDWKVW